MYTLNIKQKIINMSSKLINNTEGQLCINSKQMITIYIVCIIK